MNHIDKWLEEKIEITGNVNDSLYCTHYYNSYEWWCLDNGLKAISPTDLRKELRARGFLLTNLRSLAESTSPRSRVLRCVKYKVPAPRLTIKLDLSNLG